MRARRLAIVATFAALAGVLLGALPAAAWHADFFEGDASGNATYEAMVIGPEALYDAVSDCTYIAFQGADMDCYVTAYDHTQGGWLGTYRAGDNPLSTDPHGGPSLFIDEDGYLHVLYGAHNVNQMRHARSSAPRDITRWEAATLTVSGEPLRGTYPQVSVDASQTVWLFYREGATLDWRLLRSIEASAGVVTWGERETVIDSHPTSPTPDAWYANGHLDEEGALHVACALRDLAASTDDQFQRRGLYYFVRGPDGTCRNVAGEAVTAPWERRSTEPTCAVPIGGAGEFTNQVVVDADPSGRPAILYLTGDHDPASYQWRMSRWNGSAWEDSLITTTDNFFDAGTFAFRDDGTIEAFLTTGGVADDQGIPEDDTRFATRGGDIARWTWSETSGWSFAGTVLTSPGPWARYNDPQLVLDGLADARLVVSEWNNDASNFMHTVYLWGGNGAGTFKQKEFTPALTRLAGENRIATSVAISRQAYPAGTDTVLIASAWNFPDVLCGVPLAQSYRAPILLVDQSRLRPEAEAELVRLKNAGLTRVVVLGGEASVGAAVTDRIKQVTGIDAQRIGGVNRYETSAMIAAELAKRRPDPPLAIVASGANFPDALAVSPYAARQGVPIVLTPPDALSPYAAGVLSGVPRAIIVGGTGAVSAGVESSITRLGLGVSRWQGRNRYETAAEIARQSLAAGHSTRRFVVSSGENFADAVAGGAYAARLNGIVVITSPAALSPATATLLEQRATRVLDVYVLGGPVAISPDVENAIASLLLRVNEP